MKCITDESLLRTIFLSGCCHVPCSYMQVLQLQQQLASVELQLHKEEVLVQKINSLERDNGDLSALREKQHEEKTIR